MTAQAGGVYHYHADTNRLVVVLTGATYNSVTRRPVVCPLVLTEEVISPVAADPLHTITPSPGFVAYPLRFWVPDTALAGFVGNVEPGVLQRVQRAARDGYTPT